MLEEFSTPSPMLATSLLCPVPTNVITLKEVILGWVWCFIPVIQLFGRQREKDYGPMPVWAKSTRCYLKN
jgi:uncharacterized membrane protein YhaH (DUF805 family)